MINPVRGSWIGIEHSPYPYLPTHPKEVSTGMDGDERG
jgi:hypothetical protein